MIPFDFKAAPARTKETDVLVPAGIESKTDLLAFLARALSLPGYFGHNWDALEECLGDPGVLGPRPLALIHQDVPLENNRHDQRIYLEILSGAATKSDHLQVIFPEESRAQIVRVLSAME